MGDGTTTVTTATTAMMVTMVTVMTMVRMMPNGNEDIKNQAAMAARETGGSIQENYPSQMRWGENLRGSLALFVGIQIP
jgi:hypothetical protein